MPLCDCIYSSNPSPGQRPDLMTKSPMRKLPIRHSSPRSSRPPPHILASRGTKRIRADLCRSSVDNQSNALVQYHVTTPSSSEDEPGWQSIYEANSNYYENSSSEDETEPWYHKRPSQEFKLHQPPLEPQNHDLQVHRLKLQPLSTKEFKRWGAGVEYTAPSDDRLPPRKRFKASHLQSSHPRHEEADSISDQKFVLVSHPMRSRGFYHLACPYNIYAPARFQRCLQCHLQSIEDVTKHLLREHSRHHHCYICNKEFETVIHRDNHIIDNICMKRDPDPIAGLNEDQKAMLISRDRYYRGEKKRWCRIWSIVFPASKPPQSPYLDRGCGLVVSMARDFWELNGRQCVADYLKDEGFDGERNENSHDILFEVALDDLLKEIVKEHEPLTKWRD
ncbi:hypothetical protein FSHL1_009742 [Fusarium sambucinum]